MALPGRDGDSTGGVGVVERGLKVEAVDGARRRVDASSVSIQYALVIIQHELKGNQPSNILS